MRRVSIELEERKETGTSASRRFRRQQRIPINIFGQGRKGCLATIGARQVQQAKFSQYRQVLVNYKISGDSGEEGMAILREMQAHPVSGKPLHLDFQRIAIDKPLRAEIPVRIVGEDECPGSVAGGTVEISLHSLLGEALPDKFPEFLDIDISSLDLSQSLHVSDYVPPEGLKILSDPKRTLVTISLPSALVSEKDKETETAAAPDAGEAAAEGAPAQEGESGEKKPDESKDEQKKEPEK